MQLHWNDDLALRAADYALRRFEASAVAVHNASRLPTVRACVARSRKHSLIEISTGGMLAERVLEAHRTIMELYCVASVLQGPGDPLAEIIPLALKGADLARDDQNSQARNHQFECFILALIRLCEITDVTVGEPDIRIKAGERHIGIAAKRISSLEQRQREKNIRKAASQIRAQGEIGFIVLNLDASANHAWSTGGHDAGVAVVRDLVEGAKSWIQERRLDGGIVGIYGFATLLGWNIAVDPAILSVDMTAHAAFIVPEPEQPGVLRFVAERSAALQRSLVQLMSTVESLPPDT